LVIIVVQVVAKFNLIIAFIFIQVVLLTKFWFGGINTWDGDLVEWEF
jgi:hypothetical protein